MMTISNGTRTGSWHVGDNYMNIPEGRVITIQLDGHELEWFLDQVKHDGYVVNYPAERLTPVL